MHTKTLLAGLLLGGTLLVGCEERPSATPTTPRTTTPAPGAGTTATADQSDVARAQGLIDEVNTHIRNKDFDQAETSLEELIAMRDKLPMAMQTQINTLRTTLETARRGATTVPPTIPTTPPTTTPPTTPPTEPGR